MKKAIKVAALAICGGCAYYAIEMLWRGHSHWTMAVLGGICFVLIGGINELFTWDMPLIEQGIIGAAAVTALELISGCVLNIWLGLQIWDYSGRPLNLLGQICLLYSCLWIPLAMCAVVLDDWIRCLLFGEECPTYTLFKRGTKK